MDLYGPMRDVARKYLKSIPHTKGVPTQGEVDDLTRTLEGIRMERWNEAVETCIEVVKRQQVSAHDATKIGAIVRALRGVRLRTD